VDRELVINTLDMRPNCVHGGTRSLPYENKKSIQAIG
jgi:hypothetical protein